MRKVAAFLILFYLAALLPAYEDVRQNMNRIGYQNTDALMGVETREKDVDTLPLYFFSKLEQLSLGEGGITLSGNTGLIELPTAFISSHGYYTIGGHALYTDADFNMQGSRFNSRKYEYITHVNYGFRRNAECGFNAISVKNRIRGGASNYAYTIRKDFITAHIKWSTPYKGKAVAFGAQITNLSNEDQLLMDYMDLEKMNGYYVAVSDQVSPRLFTNFTLKNTFVRSVDIPPIHLDRSDLTIAGAGVEYRKGYTSLMAEAKKMFGDYINDGNDFAFNVGMRYRNWRLTWDFSLVNINNGSDALYTGGVNYTF